MRKSNRLVQEVSSFGDKFYSYFHMSRHQFNGILAIVNECISEDQNNPIGTIDRLPVCVNYNDNFINV